MLAYRANGYVIFNLKVTINNCNEKMIQSGAYVSKHGSLEYVGKF